MKTLVMHPRVPLHPSALFPAVEDEAFSEDTHTRTRYSLLLNQASETNAFA